MKVQIAEMDCPADVDLLTNALLPLVGLESRLEFDLLQRTLRVDLAGLSATSEQIRQAIHATGMRALPVLPEAAAAGGMPMCTCCGEGCSSSGTFWKRRGGEVLCAISGMLWLSGIAAIMFTEGSFLAIFKESAAIPTVVIVFWLAATVCGVWQVLSRAVASVRALRPDMNLLMILAVSGAIGIGEYSEGASVAFLFALANQLEAWSVGRARNAVQALMQLTPNTALVLAQPSGLQEINPRDITSPQPSNAAPVAMPVAAVPKGSRILVRPGDRIPLDGIVRLGVSTVDQAPITGESLPVSKSPGDTVYAGTINADGALEVETTKAVTESTLARITRMVDEAQAKRARAVQWVEKFAAVYTPLMLGVSLLFAVVPPLLFDEAWDRWFYEALVILVISCPCALVISTPVSIVSGIASAARHGVLIKGGPFLELPATLDTVALDKTGTLTLGAPFVTQVTPFGDLDEKALLCIAAALESKSNHPIAAAILQHATAMGIAPVEVTEAQTRPGLGAQGRIQGTSYYIGNLRFLEEADATKGHVRRIATIAQAEQEQRPGTMVFVWSPTAVLGCITVEDIIRPQSRHALAELKEAGITSIVMLTGDHAGAASTIAKASGVTQYFANLLPEDKTQAIAALVAAGKKVAMVGDGVNDAPAMALSHLGVAMGSIGTDVAIETADVALMSDDLTKLPWLIRHSRRTLRIIKANIAFSLGIKAIFLLLATLQLASLWTAILADLGTSIFVIFNGLRLLRIKP